LSLSLIVAVSRNGIIGAHGDMPWGRELKPDLRRFKAITLGHPVIMGRKTWDSLVGKPLVERTNIVVSRGPLTLPAGMLAASSLDEALALAAKAPGGEEAMLIGGGQLYAAALGLVKRIYLTRILKDYAGDTHFSALDPAAWAAIGRVNVVHASLPYEFLTLQRSHL
jgi:dihydrofolate reductase